jgi:hypothetical protein
MALFPVTAPELAVISATTGDGGIVLPVAEFPAAVDFPAGEALTTAAGYSWRASTATLGATWDTCFTTTTATASSTEILETCRRLMGELGPTRGRGFGRHESVRLRDVTATVDWGGASESRYVRCAVTGGDHYFAPRRIDPREFVAYTTSGDWVEWSSPPRRTPEERLREIIRSRTAPAVVTRGDGRPGLHPPADFRERRARETLEKIVGPAQYRRFLAHGFVTVRAASGWDYQVYPGTRFTRVFRGGVPEPSLCVVLNGEFPPTDSLIVRVLMLLDDEGGFRRLAVAHAVPDRRLSSSGRPARPVQPGQPTRTNPPAVGPRPLGEVYDSLRGSPRRQPGSTPAARAAG